MISYWKVDFGVASLEGFLILILGTTRCIIEKLGRQNSDKVLVGRKNPQIYDGGSKTVSNPRCVINTDPIIDNLVMEIVLVR